MSMTEKQPKYVFRHPRDKDKPHKIYRKQPGQPREILGHTRKGKLGWEVRREGEDTWYTISPKGNAPHTSAMWWLDGDSRFRAENGFIVGSLRSDGVSPDVQEDSENAAWIADNKKTAKKHGGGKGQGFAIDQKVKVEVENYAMKAAEAYYQNDGWEVDSKAYQGNPFDLICRREGHIKHVEVKGTLGSGTRVFLTPNEVDHARECHADEPCQSTALYIICDIKLDPTGKVIEGTGTDHRLDPWPPIDDNSLKPTNFQYQVPDL